MRFIVNTKTLFLSGSIAFYIGFGLIYLFDTTLWIYYLGAVFFGFSIAILSPVLLTILTNYSKESTKSIGIYNALVAISSAFSPGIAEVLLNNSLSALTLFWMIGSTVLVCISIYSFIIIKRNTREITNAKIEQGDSCNSSFIVLKTYKNIFIILFLTSISYGSIISYLPIYYANTKTSIGLFYFFFWGFYVLAQGIGAKIIKRVSKHILIYLCLVGLLISQILINMNSNIICEILSASTYGLSYGLMYYVFYQLMAMYKDEHTRSNGFAIVGLMSYIGVGVAPIFLYPFLNDLNTLFFNSSVYIGMAIICFYVCNRRSVR